MFSRVITVIIGLAALFAAVISYNLTTKHIRGSSGLAWFEAACSNESGPSSMNCTKVLNSPYSYVPPKQADQSGGLHLPASFLGFFYYSALFVWVVSIGKPSFSRRWVHAVPLIFVVAGLCFSAWFIYIMASVIAEWCPWCLVTHGLNLLIALGLVAIWPRQERAGTNRADIAVTESASAAMTLTAHPTNRLLLATCLTIFFIAYGHLFFFEWLGAVQDSKHLKAEIEVLRSNVGGYIAQWQLASVCDLPIRPDDPVRRFGDSMDSGPFLNVVVFSDFECPGCGKFAEFFEKMVPPLFERRVQLVFRHFPLDQACNPRATKTLHAHACSSVFLAEGARMVGGNNAFWRAHDYLFSHRPDIASGALTTDRLAAAIGLDASALTSAGNSQAHTARMNLDVEQAARCGVTGTPGVFVEGRRVEPAAVANIQFWDKVADWFWLEKVKREPPGVESPPPDRHNVSSNVVSDCKMLGNLGSTLSSLSNLVPVSV